ncbi:transcriptional regulator, XRE family with cupin sensor [Lachnospiraceae bacterium XBB1006]|nr:transcriptional regulator, XRE family with cupin sensor [Lachnospiraceae bacterium XBB1006]
MDTLTQRVAENFKEIRKKRELSLEQAAKLTGISKSMLSQLERGEVNPTITTVYKLSMGLKVPVTAFTSERMIPISQVSKQFIDPLTESDGKYRLYPLFNCGDHMNFEIFDLEFDVGGEMQGHRQLPGTREYITLYKGELTLLFNDREYILTPGDSASYNAFDDYVYKNTGDCMIEACIVVQYARV